MSNAKAKAPKDLLTPLLMAGLKALQNPTQESSGKKKKKKEKKKRKQSSSSSRSNSSSRGSSSSSSSDDSPSGFRAICATLGLNSKNLVMKQVKVMSDLEPLQLAAVLADVHEELTPHNVTLVGGELYNARARQLAVLGAAKDQSSEQVEGKLAATKDLEAAASLWKSRLLQLLDACTSMKMSTSVAHIQELSAVRTLVERQAKVQTAGKADSARLKKTVKKMIEAARKDLHKGLGGGASDSDSSESKEEDIIMSSC